MERFRDALPSLLEDSALRGRWVVFKDGEVLQAFEERIAARRWAVERLGRLAGFVVVPVEPDHVYHLSGFSRCGFRLPDAGDE